MLFSKSIEIVKNKIHRMSIKGAKELITEESVNSTAEYKHTKVTTTATNVEEFIMQNDNSLNTAKIQDIPKELEVSPTMSITNTSTKEPIYAVVDLKSKYALRKIRNRHAELKRYNSYDSIIHAATDLYKMHRKEKSSSLIEDDIDGIYEDGDMFCSKANRDQPTSTVEEENIYEPINVPPPPLPHISTHRKAIWKYFTRLKVNLIRIRKRGSDYDSIKLSKKSPPKKEPSNSHFSTIKHKFGTHRKSMQVHMRKLCARAYEPRPFFSHNNTNKQQNNNITNSVSSNNNAKQPKKYYWKSVKIKPKKLYCYGDATKVQKQIFGSLPHIRERKVHSSILDANVTQQIERNCNRFENRAAL
ncbi:uncharacterized protein LOC119676031 [Teleopsis dalmanni]|uniref:uncharacterized protein LOC119676031 n=1 Tax=Teleopsis dalmanni TaxID=139649 RepID=UPI0018CD1D1E|nr:uncharacterized protein LOC119676031 [Teleopsis dalmanni]